MPEDTLEVLRRCVEKKWRTAQFDSGLNLNADIAESGTVPEYTYHTFGNRIQIEFTVDQMPVRKDTDMVKILADIKDSFPFCSKYNCIIGSSDGIKQKIILVLE